MESASRSIYKSDTLILRYLISKDEMLEGEPSPLSQYIDAITDEPSNILFGVPQDFIYMLTHSSLD